jgi:hypothetical protein
MGLSPRYQWRKTRQRNTPKTVGTFFEKIALTLFDGTRGHDSEGDLVIWHVPLGMEIKASDNNHTFRIPIDQLEKYYALAQGFPFEYFLYGLFCYRNRAKRGRKRKTLLQGCRHEEHAYEILSGNIDTLYLYFGHNSFTATAFRIWCYDSSPAV